MSSISFADECNPPLPFLLVPVDLTDDASVKQGVARVIVREGRIGVLGNNAGDGLAGQWKIHFNDGLEDAFYEMKKALKRAASRFKKR